MNTSFDLYPGIIFILMFLGGIRLMNSPKTALAGNLLGSFGMLLAVIYALAATGIAGMWVILVPMGIGALIGYFIAVRVAMIEMPQLVALLNGLGGGASAGTALAILGGDNAQVLTASLALFVGGATLGGSLLAAGKLARMLPQKPVVMPYHSMINTVMLISVGGIIAGMVYSGTVGLFVMALVLLLMSLAFGAAFTVRIGGADMPITISLLNSLSGLAGSVAGFAIGDPLLVATGAIVGSAGLILTRIMCTAMNRSLGDILLGKTSIATRNKPAFFPGTVNIDGESAKTGTEGGINGQSNAAEHLNNARTVFFVPGYGMALSQAQHRVKEFSDLLESQGKDVKFAIHPVAGENARSYVCVIGRSGCAIRETAGN